MYEIKCNSVNPADGDCDDVSFSFIDGIPENGVEISFGKNNLYFEVDEFYLIAKMLKEEKDRRIKII